MATMEQIDMGINLMGPGMGMMMGAAVDILMPSATNQ